MAFLGGIGKTGEVAERSPAVYSANLKEDILFKKKLQVLNRSEKSVVHQIKVDQKVLYRRFQAKLVRSRLGFARIMGQKNVEKELRSKNLGGLNTDIAADSDQDYTFLEKLECRPCTADSYLPRCQQPMRQTSSTSSVNTVGSTRQGPRGRSMSLQATDMTQLKSTTAKNKTGKEASKKLPLRPSTTSGIRVEDQIIQKVRERNIPSTKDQKPESIMKINHRDDTITYQNGVEGMYGVETVASSLHTDSVFSSPAVSQRSDEQNTASDDKHHTQIPDKPRPKTVIILPTVSMESPMSSPRGTLSRRHSRATDFFQEEEKVDILEVRLAEARAKDYTSKVHSFCEELEQLECAQYKPNADYYSTRLRLAVDKGKELHLVDVPGTPEEEYKRAVGNIRVRSLTMPFLDLNFPTSKKS